MVNATLFNVQIMNAPTIEKRLMINIKAVRKLYNDAISNTITWIGREYNLADPMTKPTIIAKLIDVLKVGKLYNEIE